jgi:hypothetical protein
MTYFPHEFTVNLPEPKTSGAPKSLSTDVKVSKVWESTAVKWIRNVAALLGGIAFAGGIVSLGVFGHDLSQAIKLDIGIGMLAGAALTASAVKWRWGVKPLVE